MAHEKNRRTSPIDIERHLSGIDFPASKQDLLDHAESLDAPQDVLNVLRRMPDREYNSAADVTESMGSVQ